MSLTRGSVVFVAACVLAGLVVGCGAQDANTDSSPAKKTDQEMGQGVIALHPAIAASVYALGQEKHLIALGDDCDYPPKTKNLPKVGAEANPDIAAITKLKPGLIMATAKTVFVRAAGRESKAPVFAFPMGDFEETYSSLFKIGAVLGAEADAMALREKVKADAQALRDALKDVVRPRVLITVHRGSGELEGAMTAGGPACISEIVEAAGGDNIYGGAMRRELALQLEAVAEKAPEVILEFGPPLDDAASAVCLADWEAIPELPALNQGRIHRIDEAFMLCPGPRIPEAIRFVARLLHPDVDLP